MVTKEEFSNLYEQFSEWQKSQEGQTDGYEYERSFESFAQQMNKTLFKMSTHVDESDTTISERSKKKSKRNTEK